MERFSERKAKVCSFFTLHDPDGRGSEVVILEPLGASHAGSFIAVMVGEIVKRDSSRLKDSNGIAFPMIDPERVNRSVPALKRLRTE